MKTISGNNYLSLVAGLQQTPSITICFVLFALNGRFSCIEMRTHARSNADEKLLSGFETQRHAVAQWKGNE